MVDLPFSNSYKNVGGGTVGGDACLIYNTGGLKTVALSPSESVVMAIRVVLHKQEVLQ
jgi:hypothetical protein